MAIDNPMMVDGMGTEVATGALVLTISDHLDWVDESAHLSAMQNKLNAYFDFISSGQIFELNPQARDTPLRIDVIAKYKAPSSTDWFFRKIDEAARKNDVGFEYKQLPDGY